MVAGLLLIMANACTHHGATIHVEISEHDKKSIHQPTDEQRALGIYQPYNDSDIAFMTGMIPHHAQAVLMADWAPSHGARSVRGRPVGHEDRLRVMRNHAGHEGDVGVVIRLINSQRALLVRRLVDRLLVMLAYLDVDRRPMMGARVSHDEQESRYHAAQKCPSHRSFSDKRDGTTILQDLKR